MSPKLLGSLLAVSLALNVFVVGGVVYSKVSDRSAQNPEAALETVVETVGLSADSMQALKALRETARARWQTMRPEKQRLRGEMVDELAKPALDQARVAALMDQRSDLRRQRIVDTMTDLHAFLASLPPEQRERFVALAKERGFFRKLFGRSRKNR